MRSLTRSLVRFPSSGSVHACSFSAIWQVSVGHSDPDDESVRHLDRAVLTVTP